MATVTWPPKDPGEEIDYELDWGTKRLAAGETIVSSQWEVAEGTVEIMASPAPSIGAGEITKVWLEGGAVDETCVLNNIVTTSAGRRREASAKLKIKDK